MVTNPKRGEVYFLDFSRTKHKEIRGIHPALVIQNDVGNKASQLTIVSAITSTLKVAELPVGVLISPEESGLEHKSVVHLGQIYTVDKRRLRNLVGTLSASKMKEVDIAIQVSLGLKPFRI